MATSNTNTTSNKRNTALLTQGTYDVLIIGGGITGAWLALHCAQQGFKTALIERSDFAAATSSASSKLLHGGIRYLQQFQFDKVRESALERAHYIYAAPHLSTSVPFIIPTYPDFKRSKFFLNCGMAAYRVLSLGENALIDSKQQQLPTNYSINAEQLNQICDLDNEAHTGGVVFYERHMLDSERMVLAILQSAEKLGADIYNYVRADQFTGTDDAINGVQATDLVNDTCIDIQSNLVVNAAGPFIDNLNSSVKGAESAPKINGFAVGSHIVTRQLCDYAIAITTKHQSDAKIDRGGRHVFIIPWRDHSLIGTSYDEIDSPNGDLSITADHVDQLLDAVNEGIPSANLSREDIVSGYSGLYPLHTDNIKSTVYQGSGEYQIIDHATANGVSGLVTALGAKFTTGRKISALTLELIGKKLGQTVAVEKHKLEGSQYDDFAALIKQKTHQYADLFSTETITHLVMLYGSEIDDFIASVADKPALHQPICASQPDIMGQVIWAIEHEQALTLEDILYRRTSLGLLGIQTAELNSIAELMATELNWTAQNTAAQIKSSTTKLQAMHAAILGKGEEKGQQKEAQEKRTNG